MNKIILVMNKVISIIQAKYYIIRYGLDEAEERINPELAEGRKGK